MNPPTQAAGSTYPWYGVRTKPQSERITAVSLENQGYQAFLPLCKKRRKWSDRTVVSEQPLFPGYLFCRFDVLRRLPIITTRGVVAIVGLGRIPEPIPEEEITRIQTVVRSGLSAEPWPYVREGERVRIVRGPLEGIEGLFVRKKNEYRFVLSVDLLQRSLAVELDRECIQPIRASLNPGFHQG